MFTNPDFQIDEESEVSCLHKHVYLTNLRTMCLGIQVVVPNISQESSAQGERETIING